MNTLGVVGSDWRADVDIDGSVSAFGSSVSFAVAADDRWHVPHQEATLRQRRVEGTPVIETRVRIPDGDLTMVAYAVADDGGSVVLEVTNDSPLPVALACTSAALVSSRPPTAVPIEGIELPDGAVSYPIGHRSTIRLALTARGASPRLAALPSAEQVVRGWQLQCAAEARMVVPGTDEAVVSARTSLMLDGPATDDPVAGLLGVAELIQMGGEAAPWVEFVAEQAMSAVRSRRHDPLLAAALRDGALVLSLAGEDRAVADTDRMLERAGLTEVPMAPVPLTPGTGDVRWLASLRHRLLEDRGALDLFPGWDRSWFGQGIEIHRIATRSGRISAAVRWHDRRPALLWDHERPGPITCRFLDANWSTEGARGEALLALQDFDV